MIIILNAFKCIEHFWKRKLDKEFKTHVHNDYLFQVGGYFVILFIQTAGRDPIFWNWTYSLFTTLFSISVIHQRNCLGEHLPNKLFHSRSSTSDSSSQFKQTVYNNTFFTIIWNRARNIFYLKEQFVLFAILGSAYQNCLQISLWKFTLEFVKITLKRCLFINSWHLKRTLSHFNSRYVHNFIN
jgi:hypothetical protein